MKKGELLTSVELLELVRSGAMVWLEYHAPISNDWHTHPSDKYEEFYSGPISFGPPALGKVRRDDCDILGTHKHLRIGETDPEADLTSHNEHKPDDERYLGQFDAAEFEYTDGEMAEDLFHHPKRYHRLLDDDGSVHENGRPNRRRLARNGNTVMSRKLTVDILFGKTIKDAAAEINVTHSVMCKMFYRECRLIGIVPQDTNRFLTEARHLVQTISSLKENPLGIDY